MLTARPVNGKIVENIGLGEWSRRGRVTRHLAKVELRHVSDESEQSLGALELEQAQKKDSRF